MRVSGLFACCLARCRRPLRRTMRRCRRPLRGLQMQKKRAKERAKKRCTTNTKKYAERAWPCGRAASGRVAWRGVLKKYAPAAGFHCCRMVQTAASRPTKPKERAKKGKKKGLAGQKPRLSRSEGFMRPECGGGVCQPGGWLGCTFYAGSSRKNPGAA